MTRDERLLKGDIRAASILFDIYRAGTIHDALVWRRSPPGASSARKLGLGGRTRALTSWMMSGVSTWDGYVVNIRRLKESSVVMACKAVIGAL